MKTLFTYKDIPVTKIAGEFIANVNGNVISAGSERRIKKLIEGYTKRFSIDDQEPASIDEIINDNEDLSQTDISRIDNLEVGEWIFIGIDEVKIIE